MVEILTVLEIPKLAFFISCKSDHYKLRSSGIKWPESQLCSMFIAVEKAKVRKKLDMIFIN